MFRTTAVLAGVVILSALQPVQQRSANMSFFITSAGSGNGANLGGLAGADAICQRLAAAVGAGSKTWHAYLSTQATGAQAAVNARDRIGTGPWFNFKGEQIAANVNELHSDAAKLTKQTILTEKGDTITGRGNTPNRHDVLTGSTAEGRAFPPDTDNTCSNWTSNIAGAGSAMLGHHDRQGAGGAAPTSWNSSHLSRGCSQDNLRATGGDGLFYCFAIN